MMELADHGCFQNKYPYFSCPAKLGLIQQHCCDTLSCLLIVVNNVIVKMCNMIGKEILASQTSFAVVAVSVLQWQDHQSWTRLIRVTAAGCWIRGQLCASVSLHHHQLIGADTLCPT